MEMVQLSIEYAFGSLRMILSSLCRCRVVPHLIMYGKFLDSAQRGGNLECIVLISLWLVFTFPTALCSLFNSVKTGYHFDQTSFEAYHMCACSRLRNLLLHTVQYVEHSSIIYGVLTLANIRVLNSMKLVPEMKRVFAK